MKILRKILTVTVCASEWLAAIGVLICVCINLAQVAFRYFLSDPLPWSEEVMRYLMVWVAMLGATAALGRRELPAVDMAAGLRTVGLRRALQIMAGIALCTFCVTLIVAGWPTLKRAYQAVSPAAEIPLYLPYLAVFTGAALMTLLTIVMLALKQPLGGDGSDG